MVVIIAIIGLTSWPYLARIVRAEFLTLKESEFVLAARATGSSTFDIIFRHILPNAAAPILVTAVLGVPEAILAEAGLSFLGFGVHPPDVSLGTLIADGTKSATTFPWVFLFPAGVLVLILLCANLIGDGLRDALDPGSATLRRRRKKKPK